MEKRINSILNGLHEFAVAQKDFSFEEFIDFCVYPEMINKWIEAGMSNRKIKECVLDLFYRYEEQRKLLSVG